MITITAQSLFSPFCIPLVHPVSTILWSSPAHSSESLKGNDLAPKRIINSIITFIACIVCSNRFYITWYRYISLFGSFCIDFAKKITCFSNLNFVCPAGVLCNKPAIICLIHTRWFFSTLVHKMVREWLYMAPRQCLHLMKIPRKIYLVCLCAVVGCRMLFFLTGVWVNCLYTLL